MRQISFILTILLILSSCDCRQHVKGLVLDQNTEYEISNVKIWETSKTDFTLTTDSFGYFEFKSISGGLFKCPDLQLNFKKGGYKLKTVDFKPYSSDTFLIYLEKDFDFSKIRKSIADTVVTIEKANFVSSGVVGDQAKTPKIWYTRHWLIDNATIDELLVLIKYPNSAVSATVFEGLYKQGYPDLYNILIDIIDNSNEPLDYISGCEGDIISLGEYCYRIVLRYELPPKPPFPPDKNRKVNFTSEQRNIIKRRLKNGG